MKRVVIAAALMGVLVVFAALAKRVGSRMQNVDWEEKLQAMPENAPPKWVFRNITAIRENTDHILELLEHRSASD